MTEHTSILTVNTGEVVMSDAGKYHCKGTHLSNGVTISIESETVNVYVRGRIISRNIHKTRVV